MKWPWVSRKAYENVLSHLLPTLERLQATEDRLAEAEKQANVSNALRRDEQWRRIKAEGLAAYKDDRIRQAREMMLPYIGDEPVTAKRKAIPE